MKKIKLVFLMLSVLAFNVGCAHYHKIMGTEQRSEIPEGVRVKIGSPEVKEGDSVDIFKKVCPKRKSNAKIEQVDHSCDSVKVGTSKVIKILTKDTAIIETPTFKVEGEMTVEKSDN
tara:strand:- start:16732 stop:17082 length:351 start_codon:yes stop_codon:yes gene_type:complete